MTQIDHSTLTLRVVADPAPVAPAVIATPTQPALPHTNGTTQPSIGGLGLGVLALVAWCAGHKKLLALVACALMGLWLTPAAPLKAAVLPDLNTVKVAQWDTKPLQETIIGDGPIGGFDADTFAAAPFTMASKTAHEFYLRYHLGFGEYTILPKLTLRIWQVSAQANGQYTATTVFNQTVDSRYEDGWTLHALAEFRYVPDHSGWYAYQYNASTIYDREDPRRPVASRLNWFAATTSATSLTLNTPQHMLYGQQVPIKATITPLEATDPIKWLPASGFNLTAAAADTATLTAPPDNLVNTNVNNPGFSRVMAAQAGKITTTKTIWLGGLQAYAGPYDGIPASGLHFAPASLSLMNLPPGNWRYHWELVDTYRAADGSMQANLNNILSLNNFGDVQNAEGETAKLTDFAVAFTISKTGGLLQAMMASATPKAIRLKLDPVSGGNSLYTNFASIAISPPLGTLALKQVPTDFAWQYSALELYDHLTKTVSASGSLIVEDTRTNGSWQLTAALSPTDFPFALTLNDFNKQLSSTPTILATGGSAGLSISHPQATLTPQPVITSTDSQKATITWTLTQTFPSAPLS